MITPKNIGENSLKKNPLGKIAAAIPRGSDINYILYNQLKSVSVILYCLERNRLFDISLAVFYLQDDVALLLAALYDDNEFAGEEFHLRLGERFERCGIAVAGSLESAGTTHLEGQFVIGKRTFIAVLILQTHGDESKVVAIGIQKHIVLIGTAFYHAGNRLMIRCFYTELHLRRLAGGTFHVLANLIAILVVGNHANLTRFILHIVPAQTVAVEAA